MRCGLCLGSFEEDKAQPACASCPLSRACKFVRCPHCGYENPAVPTWIRKLSAKFEELTQVE